jgi:hypothetical protein
VLAARRDLADAGKFDHRMGRQARKPSRESERERTGHAAQAGDPTVGNEKIYAD